MKTTKANLFAVEYRTNDGQTSLFHHVIAEAADIEAGWLQEVIPVLVGIHGKGTKIHVQSVRLLGPVHVTELAA